jgi:hypothetical protein
MKLIENEKQVDTYKNKMLESNIENKQVNLE